MTDLPRNLVVGTMCHCGNPDGDAETIPCDDHWQFFVDPVNFDAATGYLSQGRTLTEREMRAIVALVRGLT